MSKKMVQDGNNSSAEEPRAFIFLLLLYASEEFNMTPCNFAMTDGKSLAFCTQATSFGPFIQILDDFGTGLRIRGFQRKY
jgi:hypothetical protein